MLLRTLAVRMKWEAYTSVTDFGYVHVMVNHTQNIVDPITGAHTSGGIQDSSDRGAQDKTSWGCGGGGGAVSPPLPRPENILVAQFKSKI